MITRAEADALLAIPNKEMLPPRGAWYDYNSAKG